MISVLIPVYNINILALVNDLHEQLMKSNIEFEIICLDDVSGEKTINSNIKVNELSYTTYQLSRINNGIAATRQLLSEKARYDWILLLDADIELINNSFITNYLDLINLNHDAVFGGFSYKNSSPGKDRILRWKYGISCEAISAKKRNGNPYKIIIAANLLIKKSLYKSFNLHQIGNAYGMDLFFGAVLKQTNTVILHIDNPVYHLGIEKSSKYLRKKELAVQTLLKLIDQKKIQAHDNNLLSLFTFLKRYRFNYLLFYFFRVFGPVLKNNLIGHNPSIKLLQVYRISYMCHFDLVNKTHGIA